MVHLAQSHLEGCKDASILEILRQIIKAVLAAHAVNPRLHRVLHEQIPCSEVIQHRDQAKVESLLRSFLAQRRDQLQPENLDLTVFIIERTIKTLIHGVILDRPEFLTNGEFEQELMTMLASYLVKIE